MTSASNPVVAHYLDTSALVKLVVSESHSAALRAWLEARPRRPVSSDLARTELLRAVRRTAPELAVLARQVLEVLTILRLPTATFETAALLEPTGLRNLDAVHLAAALSLGDELEAIVTYDERLAEAATMVGVGIIGPVDEQ